MIRLNYFDTRLDDTSGIDPQPVLALGKGNTQPTRIVPIAKLSDDDRCAGCIAYGDMLQREYGGGDTNFNTTYSCYALPDCSDAIYVRATPENKLKYIAWRLENDK